MPNRIAEYRKRHKLTQDQLAKALQVNKITLWRWEHGQLGIPKDRLTQIARYFQVTLADLDPDYNVVPCPEERIRA